MNRIFKVKKHPENEPDRIENLLPIHATDIGSAMSILIVEQLGIRRTIEVLIAENLLKIIGQGKIAIGGYIYLISNGNNNSR